MNLNQLKRKRAHAARVAAAGTLGSLRQLRTKVAPLVREYVRQKKRLERELVRLNSIYENAREDDFGAPAQDPARTLVGDVNSALGREQKELAVMFAELKDQEAALAKRKPRKARRG